MDSVGFHLLLCLLVAGGLSVVTAVRSEVINFVLFYCVMFCHQNHISPSKPTNWALWTVRLLLVTVAFVSTQFSREEDERLPFIYTIKYSHLFAGATHMTERVWRSGDNFQEAVLSFRHLGPGQQVPLRPPEPSQLPSFFLLRYR